MAVGLWDSSFKNAFHTLSYRFAAVILVILYSRGKGKELKDAEQGCIADTLTDMIRENQDKNDFAERMESMFKDVEVKCVVNSFRRQEHKLNHNKHFSKWFKDTDPDYPIAESLFRKLKLKDRYRR